MQKAGFLTTRLINKDIINKRNCDVTGNGLLYFNNWESNQHEIFTVDKEHLMRQILVKNLLKVIAYFSEFFLCVQILFRFR